MSINNDHHHEASALCLLAGLKLKKMRVLDASYRHPGWLLYTEHGEFIRLEWSGQDILIDWSATKFRGLITPDKVPQSDERVQAWGYAKALEYLTELRSMLNYLHTTQEKAMVRGSWLPVMDLISTRLDIKVPACA